MIKIIILLLVFLNVNGYSQEALFNQDSISHLEYKSKIRNELSLLDKNELCFCGFSTDCSEGTSYSRNDSLIYVEVSHMGETGNTKEKVYYLKGKVFFVESTRTNYARPYYEPSQPNDENSIIKSISFFKNERYFKTILQEGELKDDKLFIKNEKYFTELLNAILVNYKKKCDYSGE